jgi:squalene-hopene/tetraprenyl-beta-curcumene cyclase
MIQGCRFRSFSFQLASQRENLIRLTRRQNPHLHHLVLLVVGSFLFLQGAVAWCAPVAPSLSSLENGGQTSVYVPQAELLKEVREAALKNLMQVQRGDGVWDQPSYLGVHYTAQYALLARWLGRPTPSLESLDFKALLLQKQLPEGPWEAIHDANVTGAQGGDLNATIVNYMYLKSVGVSTDSMELKKARSWILSQGGVERANLFTKIFLALFQQASWASVPEIPSLLFVGISPVHVDQFAQWIGPHLLPIAYLRAHQVSKDLGDAFRLKELWVSSKNYDTFRDRELKPASPASRFSTAGLLIDRMIELQRPKGSWGGYASATLFTVVCLEHFGSSIPSRAGELLAPSVHGLEFADRMLAGQNASRYLGVADDGHYWDTALAGIAAVEAGAPLEALESTARYLIANQTSEGGFPFGFDFEYAPDTDDTAEIVLFLRHFQNISNASAAIERAVRWLQRMQNDDGGWGAFAKNNEGNFLLRAFAKPFEDSAALFDPSSADVTGHILEAFGSLAGGRSDLKESIQRGIKYLEETQSPADGSWEGRWGINTLYGTGAALVGLLRGGVSPQAKSVSSGLKYLLAKQNEDGGWGESFRSYRQEEWRGRGVSTPSQTAWVLLALLEAGQKQSPAFEQGLNYLISDFKRQSKWQDHSTVGTGHPGVVSMNYPIYPMTWPLMVLGRFERGERP